MADIGKAAFDLRIEAERLTQWLEQFKPEQHHVIFPNIFKGVEIAKLLPKICRESINPITQEKYWLFQRTPGSLFYEVRFPPIAGVTVKSMPTAGTRDNPHRAMNGQPIPSHSCAGCPHDGAR